MAGLGDCGLVLRAPDRQVEAEAARHMLPVMIAPDLTTWPYPRALLVEPGAGVPWSLVGAGLHLVETWDAAASLLPGDEDQHTRLAEDLAGADPTRGRTLQLLGDLRVPVYHCDILFVRRSEVTVDLLETWRSEMAHGGDRKLAFLRALFLCKPRLCALPTVWLGEARRNAALTADGQPLARERLRTRANLVRVEYAPGRWVQCRPGEEATVVAQMQRQLFRRSKNR